MLHIPYKQTIRNNITINERDLITTPINNVNGNTSFKTMLAKFSSEDEGTRQPSYDITSYLNSVDVRGKFLDAANRQYGNNDFTSEQIREIAYYNQLRYDLDQQIEEIAIKEFDSSDGLTDDEIQDYLAPLQSQQYAIQDFLQDKYNLNGTNNSFRFGLDRDSLGFNESGASPNLEEFNTRAQLVDKGMDDQAASDLAYGMNGKTAHVYRNGELVDTGVSNMDNIYRHTGNHSYFNDPRNEGKTFNWMNYINPNALQGQIKIDGSSLDYYYSTNFIRENNLGVIKPGAKNMFDWRQHSHQELLKKYKNSI